jgi:hypothetical protein
MPKRNRLRTILLLPLATIIFAVGWILTCTQSRPKSAKKKIQADENKGQDIQFLVNIGEKEEQIKTYN